MSRTEESEVTTHAGLPTIQSLVSRLYEKVRTLSKDCSIEPPEPLRKDLQPLQVLLSVCLNSLQELRRHVILNRNMTEDYRKLEELSQRHQAQLRKCIGVQQQLRLYAETLQQKFNDEKIEFQKKISQSQQQIEQKSRQIKLLKEDVILLKSQLTRKHARRYDHEIIKAHNTSALVEFGQSKGQSILRNRSHHSSQNKSPYNVRPKIQRTTNTQMSNEHLLSFRNGEIASIPYLVSNMKKKKKKVHGGLLLQRQTSGVMTERQTKRQEKIKSRIEVEGKTQFRMKTEINMGPRVNKEDNDQFGIFGPSDEIKDRQNTLPH